MLVPVEGHRTFLARGEGKGGPSHCQPGSNDPVPGLLSLSIVMM